MKCRVSRLHALDLDDAEGENRRQQPLARPAADRGDPPLVRPGQQPEPDALAGVREPRLEAVPRCERRPVLLGQQPPREVAQVELPLDARPAGVVLAGDAEGVLGPVGQRRDLEQRCEPVVLEHLAPVDRLVAEVVGPGSSVSVQQAASSSSNCPPTFASFRSARIRSSRTSMPPTRPVSPDGQVMISDIGMHLLSEVGHGEPAPPQEVEPAPSPDGTRGRGRRRSRSQGSTQGSLLRAAHEIVIWRRCCFGTKSGAGIVRRPHADRDRDRSQARGPRTGLSWSRRDVPAPSASSRRRSCPGEPTGEAFAKKEYLTATPTGDSFSSGTWIAVTWSTGDPVNGYRRRTCKRA